MACLNQLLSSSGSQWKSSINRNDDNTKITSSKIKIGIITPEEAAIEGVVMMKDLRAVLEFNFDEEDCYIYNGDFLLYEQYASFLSTTFQSLGLSFLAVFIVVLLLTANLQASLLVILSVALTVLDLFGC